MPEFVEELDAEEVVQTDEIQALAVSATDYPKASEIQTVGSDIVIGKPAETEYAENALINALANPEQMEEYENKTIEFDNYVATNGMVINDAGQEVFGVRLVLIDTKNNKAYSTFSAPFFRAFKQIVAVKGHADKWKKPLKITIEKKKSQTSKYKYLTYKMA